MELGHLLETLMLVCFGFSWPINVMKAYKARTAKGSSLTFIILIITGYLAGISAKFVNKQINYVLVVYFLNLAFVLANVMVYFRNRMLDKKRNMAKLSVKEIQMQADKINNSAEKIANKAIDAIHNETKKSEKKNGVILMGGNFDKQIPVSKLAHSFNFNFDMYNKSVSNLSVAAAKDYFTNVIAPLAPEALLIHLGDEDVNMFAANTSEFDQYYLDLVAAIKENNSKIRLGLVSVNNPGQNEVVNKMNAHIKAIAVSEHCSFVNLDNAKLWNPKATKAASDFAYNMGLNIRKPLNDVAEVLYSYAFLEMQGEAVEADLVG